MKHTARHRARRLVIQAIYQWQLSQDEPSVIAAQLLDSSPSKKIDRAYFDLLFKGVFEHLDEIDEDLKPVLDRSIEDLTEVELAVLRMAIYELKYCKDVPYKVVINEAVELNKTFGTDDGHKYVNVMLDKIARKVRDKEI